jgi:hypothetical protein
MCGIVGAVSHRNIVPILVEGLKRLEYRGYDSCGVAVHQGGELRRARSTSRVAELRSQVAARTAWLRAPASPTRAGPRTARRRCTTRTRTFSGRPPTARRASASRMALVHNGIIENHDELRAELQARGYVFTSQTDTEVIAHLVTACTTATCSTPCSAPLPRLRGAYAIAVFCRDEPQRVVGAREGSPLVLGVGSEGRELPGQRRHGAGRRDRPDRLPGRGRRGRPAAGQALDRGATGRGRSPPGAARGAHRARAQRRGRAGPLPALHAKGNLRAAARHCRHAGRRDRHQRPSCSATAPCMCVFKASTAC